MIGPFREKRSLLLRATPEYVWPFLSRIGGDTGWYSADWLWAVRGWLDRRAGGVGLRSRRDPEVLLPGDHVDMWCVETVQEPISLCLLAEAVLPGQARLEFRLLPVDGGTALTADFMFSPTSFLGTVYWYAVLPLHVWVFRGMLTGIAKAGGVPYEWIA